MKGTIYIGIDNGVSGSLGIIDGKNYFYLPTPTKKEQSYTKKKAKISRIDIRGMKKVYRTYLKKHIDNGGDVKVMLERPMVNPRMFKATMSALRSLEATVLFFEMYDLSYSYLDSKEWQKELLSKGAKGKELKTISANIAKRLFPKCKKFIEKQGDGDGILIAEFCRRFYK